jgi:membrane fusion protein (multidrug efflux system)
LFSSASVDATTGQVTLRAEFPNPDGDLLPGMYVRVHIEQAVRKGALAIPQRP